MSDEKPDSAPSSEPHKPDGLEFVCAGIMRTEFGRRPSHAASNAIIRLAAEEAASGNRPVPARSAGPIQRIHEWLTGLRPGPALALGTALVLIIGASFYYMEQLYTTSGSVTVKGCFVSNALGMRWASDSPSLKVGNDVPPKMMHLESGVAEITFSSGAKIAIEGPARFQLLSENALEMQSGKIATEVPHRARGFTVKMPRATAVDLGTRFGAIVGNDQSSEVDVFQGKINLTTTSNGNGTSAKLSAGMAMFVDERGATPADALPESAFPQPGINMEVRPQNCGFDVSGRITTGQVPVDFGYWSGLDYTVTTATEEVRPANGPGMCEFFNPAVAHKGDSEVWQLIDMRPYKQLLANGPVQGTLSALFNRVAGTAHASGRFGLTLAAFSGAPSNAPSLWANRSTAALALADKELTADDKPETWESLEASTTLPPETDYVIVQIRAMVPKDNPDATLAGCFADLVDLRLSVPMRASSIAIQ